MKRERRVVSERLRHVFDKPGLFERPGNQRGERGINRVVGIELYVADHHLIANFAQTLWIFENFDVGGFHGEQPGEAGSASCEEGAPGRVNVNCCGLSHISPFAEKQSQEVPDKEGLFQDWQNYPGRG